MRYGRVATFILKNSAFSKTEVERLRRAADELGFTVLYAPGLPAPLAVKDSAEMRTTGTSIAHYRRLILATDRERFLADYSLNIRATTDDQPFYFHTTRLRDQFGPHSDSRRGLATA